MNKWLELAAKCEAATGPDDYFAIFETTNGIMRALGYSLRDGWWWKPDHWTSDGNRIMTSLDAITALIEREFPEWDWAANYSFEKIGKRRGIAWLSDDGRPATEGRAATPALALCAAFCRVMAAKSPEKTPETASADCK